jgi:hypothetical protein
LKKLVALMMEAARASEKLVNFYQTTRRYNPEDSHLHDKINIVEIGCTTSLKNAADRHDLHTMHSFCAKMHKMSV